MAPELQLRSSVPAQPLRLLVSVGQRGAPKTHAARRHGHFGLKPAPAQPRRGDPSRYRDFRPGKEGVTK